MGRKVARGTAALMVQRYVSVKCSTKCKLNYNLFFFFVLIGSSPRNLFSSLSTLGQ